MSYIILRNRIIPSVVRTISILQNTPAAPRKLVRLAFTLRARRKFREKSDQFSRRGCIRGLSRKGKCIRRLAEVSAWKSTLLKARACEEMAQFPITLRLYHVPALPDKLRKAADYWNSNPLAPPDVRRIKRAERMNEGPFFSPLFFVSRRTRIIWLSQNRINS